MAQKTHFNFQDVLRAAGLSLANPKANQAFGLALSKRAGERGFGKFYALSAKTNPNAKVKASHCMSTYPMEFWDEAVAFARSRANRDSSGGIRQLDLFAA